MANAPLAAVDPDVKIPAAVRAQSARSDALVQQLLDQKNAAEGVTSEVTPPAEPPLSIPLPAEPPAEPAPAPPTPAAAPPADDSWELRYKAMKGRFDRSEENVRQLSSQVSSLENVIAAMQAAPTAPTPPSADELASIENLVTPEERAEYGDDFLAVVGKKAQEMFLPTIKALEQRNAALEKRLDGVATVTAQQSLTSLHSRLDEDLPKWREINRSPEFLAWLDLPDPFSGAIRLGMLKAAYSAGNAARVLAFFNGFLNEEAATAPAEAELGTQDPETAPKVPLETFAAPGRAKIAATSPSGLPAEKPVFTRAQIAGFYADVAAGRYRGREQQKNQTEAQIFSAQAEGRIR